MNISNKTSPDQSGFSMIEVLITLVILMVGLLGLAGLMVQAQRAETESYQRVQALILLQDMVGRINANRLAASCYAITTDTAGGSPYLGTGTATPTACAAGATGTAAQQTVAIQDMADWNALLQGAAETKGSNSVGAMIGARGCISVDTTTTPSTYQVSVSWQGLGETAAPPAAWSCATNQYGTETKRRVVSTSLRIAKLS